MASCLKCGQAKLRRDKRGRRKCRHCGVMPSGRGLDMGGNAPVKREGPDSAPQKDSA